MGSPVSHPQHGRPHFHVITWLGHYEAATGGTEGGDSSSIRLDLDNMPQPDAYLLIGPTHGGQARISEDGYVEGAPELIVEVASSSASYDLHEKFRVYRRNGVNEYVVWRIRDRVINWFILRDGTYETLPITTGGLYRSEVFPGLWLDPEALIRRDMSTVLQVAQRGHATPEHAAFVERLQIEAARRAERRGGERP
jgi:Uma2 family endonuclease